MRTTSLLCAAAVILTGRLILAADPPAVFAAAQEPKARFEVASVKPQGNPSIQSAPDAFPRVRPGGLFNPTHATVESLLMFAYDLRPNRIVGGPEWVRRDSFQINATAGRDAPAAEIKLMVRSLLEDRFGLVTHVEPRDMRHQALVRTRPDGPTGPGLLVIDECSVAAVNDLRRKFPDKYPNPIANPGMISSCSSPGLSTFADMLAIGLETPVIDATGLKGSFYFFIRSQFRMFPAVGLGASRTESDPNLPALSTALKEQLGLELESRSGPVEFLVIDSVQRPTEN